MASQRQTNEDIRLVKYYLIYPVILDVLQRNIEQIKSGNWKLPDVFTTHLKLIQKKVNKEYFELRQEMRSRGIKVFEEKRDQKGISAKYLCRGYRYEMSLLWMLVKSETRIKLANMFGFDIGEIDQ
ncbi:hypothetical protein [Paenibacillus sp. ISL-20]|uniref:hypothetical protein n=1 Tax=Paenibacillus sp. ISL-20 TaxID=2819163 RepID=UPI001BEA75E0|nr:hypothetical protein [Paenibacillus sp. ISL-20]MBT2759945.1 hypothetical protein [Paenibacillus sp. ISL-20]